ncbi:MAG TPA: nucleoside phosphorylase [Puia sp.]|nr:nucleoside phosphorylase [Puia sp.]
MQAIEESELILNSRGAVYHLDLRPEELAPTVLTVGDPDRVEKISRYFDGVEHRRQHREFVTHTGRIGRKQLSVVSTGIGTDNIDIVLNELDALVNIDLTTRMVKQQLTTLTIVRIGTTGALQKDIPVDARIASTHGLGIDNLLNFYRHEENSEEKELLQSFATQTQLHHRLAQPYITGASASLLRHFTEGFHQGITVTCPGFYGPQGRVLRIGLSQPELIDRLTDFSYGRHRITNFEMETAGIYGLGKILGHSCLSLSVVVANRLSRQFSRDGDAAMDGLIRQTLSVVEGLG